jgi:murein DD-endopeptidase MepM/ murein hydrolase activator NlpD
MRTALLVLLFVPACFRSAPTTLPPYVHVRVDGDSLRVSARNPIPAPSTFVIEVQGTVRVAVLPARDSVELVALPLAGRDSAAVAEGLRVSATVGDHRARPDTSVRYAFPFPPGRSYRVIQAHNGSFSHTSDYSRYAIDFSLSVGDTITAARDGVVVTVVERHERGGNDRSLRDQANFVTVHHADGMLTQYVHLIPDGALVEQGDSVETGDAVGISGATGFTSQPHLHFNVLQPGIGGAQSVPVAFEHVDGRALRRGDETTH